MLHRGFPRAVILTQLLLVAFAGGGVGSYMFEIQLLASFFGLDEL